MSFAQTATAAPAPPAAVPARKEPTRPPPKSWCVRARGRGAACARRVAGRQRVRAHRRRSTAGGRAGRVSSTRARPPPPRSLRVRIAVGARCRSRCAAAKPAAAVAPAPAPAPARKFLDASRYERGMMFVCTRDTIGECNEVGAADPARGSDIWCCGSACCSASRACICARSVCWLPTPRLSSCSTRPSASCMASTRQRVTVRRQRTRAHAVNPSGCRCQQH
jgi:hypothetical protein